MMTNKISIRDKRGAENLAVDHLSRLKNPELGKLTKDKIKDLLPEEQLMSIANQSNEPCGPSRGHHGIATTARKVYKAGFYWPNIFHDARKLTHVKELATSLQRMKRLRDTFKSVKSLTFRGLTSWDRFLCQTGTDTF
ncbi:hypothetical protein Tco_0646644 [Tanacetum coccineum]